MPDLLTPPEADLGLQLVHGSGLFAEPQLLTQA